MSHPAPDPNPPSAVINRMHRTAAAVQDHPETYDSATLAQMRIAALELAQATDRALSARARL